MGCNLQKLQFVTYDALGLIYYVWNKKNYKVTSIKDFVIKDSIKGKIGTFNFKDGKLIQKLNMYKVSDKKFLNFNFFLSFLKNTSMINIHFF